MNLMNKFIILGTAAVAVEAYAQAAAPPSLTTAESETLQLYQAHTTCMESYQPTLARQQNQHRYLLQIRENAIATQAEKMAQQRSDASMHIVIASALSEGLTQDQAASLVEEARANDEIFLKEKLQEYVPQPAVPQTPDEFCTQKLNIDTGSFGRRLRSLTEKHGTTILNPQP